MKEALEQFFIAVMAITVALAAGCSSGGSQVECETDKDCPWPKACIEGVCVGGSSGDGGTVDENTGSDTGPIPDIDCNLQCPAGTSCTSSGDTLEMYCENGQGGKTGPARTYYPDGTLQAEYGYDENGQLHGDIATYYPDGTKASEGHFEHGKEHGTFTTYYPDGKKESEISYDNGVLQGPAKAWWPNGNLKYEGQFDQGMYAGHWIWYYESGNKEKEGDFVGGTECGPWTFYYDSATPCPANTCQVESTGHRQDGIECGAWQYFWPNGQKKAEGSYYGADQDGNAVKCGQWSEYDEAGTLMNTPVFDDCPAGGLCGSC
ncbi:MAG: hypothetical protein D6806_01060 [Deltaproteobacteria bacterium]|nr:MAG: hypothetical protein D6806_01060 [Deltaproteobacteria bacterium]